MSIHDDAPVLHATRIDLPLEIRVAVITLLNQTLAYTVDLRSHVKHVCLRHGAAQRRHASG
ncbi:MAG TPA: hypothetical protein VNN62_06570 [Methylomirabilota bacterium]|jgi:hypothetical protein|nr:hypothetical protein [Methylomirabilota bacterium]